MTGYENRDGRIGRKEFVEDALYVDNDTDVEEVKEFIRSRTEKPIHLDGTVVWNFSSHAPDYQALQSANDYKLEQNRYVIPFQVAGTWAVMYHLLPESLKDAEILVYKPSTNDYRAYKNFYGDLSPEATRELQYQLSQVVNEVEDP